MEGESDCDQSVDSCLSLHEIAKNNDVQNLSKLLSLFQKQGVDSDLNKKNEKGQTPLHVAATNNRDRSHFEVIEMLLNHGADPNTKDKCGNPLLYNLVQNSCNLEVLKLFFKFKADFFNMDTRKSTILAAATESCENLDVVKFLVHDAGLDVNHQDKIGRFPLHVAAMRNKIDSHYEVLKFLLEMGADPNAKDRNGETPLYHLVRYSGNLKVFDLFLKYNADVHDVRDDGCSILFAFDGDRCDFRVMEKLINDFHLDVNHVNINNGTPLHNIFSAVFSDSINIKGIKCLVKNGANVNAFNNDGATPLMEILHTVSRSRHEKFFLENKIYLDFILEQTDFGVVHNNLHIFDYIYYENQDDFEDDERYDTSYYWKWILEHIAKLKYLSIPIHPIIQQFIDNDIDYKDYFIKCLEELVIMSNTKLKNSWLNYFNLLVDGRRKLKNYAGNRDLIKDYQNNDWLKMFPIYGASIKNKLRKGLIRRKLFDKSSISLSTNCLPIFNPNHLIVKDILDCILSKKCLSKFCETDINKINL